MSPSYLEALSLPQKNQDRFLGRHICPEATGKSPRERGLGRSIPSTIPGQRKRKKTRTEGISFTVPSNAKCRGGFFLCDPQFFVLVCSLRRQFLVSSPVSFGQPLELSTLLPKSSCAFRSEASSVMDLRWPRRTLLCLENSTVVVVQSTRTVLCTAPCAGGGGRNLSVRDRVEGTKVDGRVLFASRRRGDRQALATSLSPPRYLTVSLGQKGA